MANTAAHLATAATILLAAAACQTPPRTTELGEIGAEPRYKWAGDDAVSRRDTLFIITASGGGTRAAALTLGTLLALDDVPLSGNEHSLLGEVDIISSVSGGSVTAAYFALEGAEGFRRLEDGFIRRDGIGQLILRAINPVTFAQLSTPSLSRLDVLIDYFKDSLFDDVTYEALIGHRPYLILNAADMSGGAVFSFTQPSFDLICADLAKFRLAEAVAASAAFPVALAPLAIKNHSPCDAQIAKSKEMTGSEGDNDRQSRWPPIWVQNAAESDIEINPNLVRRGRLAHSYLNLDCGDEFDAHNCAPMAEGEGKRWVHLLDGGIADNLGLNEPLRLITTQEVSPRFLTRIFRGDIVRLVFVVVNARSEADSDLDRSGATPGAFKMLGATTGSAIDAASFGMLDRLGFIVKELIALQAKGLELEKVVRDKLDVIVVPVDFDYIEDLSCRRYFKNIATSWTLEREETDALNDMAGALVRQSRDFQDLLKVYGAPSPGGPDVARVCSALLSAADAEGS
jgi:NTE family protein